MEDEKTFKEQKKCRCITALWVIPSVLVLVLSFALLYCIRQPRAVECPSCMYAEESASSESSDSGGFATPAYTVYKYRDYSTMSVKDNTYHNDEFNYSVRIPKGYGLTEQGNSLIFAPEEDLQTVDSTEPDFVLQLVTDYCLDGADELSLDELIKRQVPRLADASGVTGSVYGDEILDMEVFDHSSFDARRFYLSVMRTSSSPEDRVQTIYGPVYAFDIRGTSDDCLLILNSYFFNARSPDPDFLEELAKSIVLE